ncbi:CheY-like chemotaxis protein [Salinibacter ruber]|uniref:response regulator transcription factor n=1 Tax=Salinibacter ruber TaxID=146919 RepID=UPI00216AB1CD|nr:hypothetical protein [Salinibacter ruber]MCS4162213.1 CheY-like chemotaxis protein [Salinibacter ruber]
MNPILIVDDHGRDVYPSETDLDFWIDEGLVEFRSDSPLEPFPEAEDYSGLCVHKSHSEYNFLKQEFSGRPVVAFTGNRTTDPTQTGNTYQTSRHDFISKLDSALRRYEESGQFDVSYFTHPMHNLGTSPSNSEADSNRSQTAETESDDYSQDVSVITFTPDRSETDASFLTYPICFQDDEDEEIDFISTLRPLADLESERPIFLEEEYGAGLKGLELLLRIRLGHAIGGDFATFPVFVRLDSFESAIAEASAAQTFMLTRSATHGSAFPNPESQTELRPVTRSGLRRLLEEVPVRPHREKDHHDLSNEWGAFRLWHGYQSLTGRSLSLPEDLKDQRDALLQHEYYAYLTARSHLYTRDYDPDEGSSEIIDSWQRRLQAFTDEESPLRILLVDDEADKGWGRILEEIGTNSTGEMEISVYPQGGSVNYKDALDHISDTDWDAVLCDLRLQDWKDPDRTRSNDPTDKAEYTGVDLIREVKDEHPFTPIIAFTASSNAWTQDAVYDAGAEGYWIKESPERRFDPSYSRENAASLLDQIQWTAAQRRTWNFLAVLSTQLQSRREDRIYRQSYRGLPNRDDAEVRESLKAIQSLVLRAFGFGTGRVSSFKETTLKHTPSDRLDVAFLQLWGCLNEILHLRFNNQRSGRCHMLRSDGSVDQYWQSPEGNGHTPWCNQLLKSGSRNLEICPWKPPEGQGSDAHYVRLLLREAGASDLEDDFDDCNDHRNRLGLIHGHSQDQNQSTDIQDHLKPMVEIIRTLLLLNPS